MIKDGKHMTPCRLPGQKIGPCSFRIDGQVAYIELSNGGETVVDVDDLLLVKDYRWRGEAYRELRYAVTTYDGKNLRMHRIITSAKKNEYVDHANHNTLDNTKANLRVCSASQNQANKRVEKRNQLGLKGVSQGSSPNTFDARISVDGKTIHLGSYPTKEEAIAAYMGAATVLWGKFAKHLS